MWENMVFFNFLCPIWQIHFISRYVSLRMTVMLPLKFIWKHRKKSSDTISFLKIYGPSEETAFWQILKKTNLFHTKSWYMANKLVLKYRTFGLVYWKYTIIIIIIIYGWYWNLFKILKIPQWKKKIEKILCNIKFLYTGYFNALTFDPSFWKATFEFAKSFHFFPKLKEASYKVLGKVGNLCLEDVDSDFPSSFLV